jgi:glycosyltransferase involved in cell wall biosynthesis
MRTILHESPDIIHTHTAKAGFLGRLAAMLTRSNAKRIHTFHGHVLYGYFSRSVSFLYGLVERFMAHFTDVIVSVGDQAQNDLEKWRIGTSSKRIVIYPGIPIGKKRDKYMARSELGIDLSKLTFAFIGRLTSIKRIDRIIEIARMCKLNSLDVQFIVAGDGSEYSKLKKSVDVERLSIHLLGWRSDVERILSAADALLLTSDNEGTPIASIQASLLGVPTISTKVGSVSDIVIDGESGILTSTLIEDIFQAILYVYNKPEVLSELGAKARTFANNKFSVERFLSDYQNLYLSVLNQR